MLVVQMSDEKVINFHFDRGSVVGGDLWGAVKGRTVFTYFLVALIEKTRLTPI